MYIPFISIEPLAFLCFGLEVKKLGEGGGGIGIAMSVCSGVIQKMCYMFSVPLISL